MLESTDLDEPQRLRALWALRVFGGLGAKRETALLNDRSPYVRAWSIQFLCESSDPPAEALAKFAELAKTDPSPVVRVYLASALQRLEPKNRWAIAEGLLMKNSAMSGPEASCQSARMAMNSSRR